MTDVGAAFTYVKGYAELCTYSRIQQLVQEALVKAVPEDKSGGAGSMFTAEDRILLAAVNADLGLPATLLDDAKYATLYWYFKSANANDANRANVLADFSTIQAKLWDGKTIPAAGLKAAKTLEQIAQRNKALFSAEKALEDANKPKVVGDRVLVPSTLVVPPGIDASRTTPPRIEIR
jgi:hypothetical protein